MKDLISILVAVYNTQAYLDRCLTSILEQTYTNIEVIVIDDGSKDRSLEICREYESKDKRVRVYTQKNGGLSAARNAGIEKTKGKYLCFIDSDDFIQNNYIEVLYKDIMKYKSDIVVCGYFKEKNKTTEIMQLKKGGVYSCDEAMCLMYYENAFGAYAWNKIFKSNLIKENGLKFDLDLRMTQDLLWVTNYIINCKKIYYEKEPLYHYVNSKTSVCRQGRNTKQFNNLLFTSLEAHKKTEKLIENESKKVKNAFDGRCVCTYMRILFNMYYSSYKNKELYLEAIQNIRRRLLNFMKGPSYGITQRMGAIVIAINPTVFFFLFSLMEKVINIDV